MHDLLAKCILINLMHVVSAPFHSQISALHSTQHLLHTALLRDVTHVPQHIVHPPQLRPAAERNPVLLSHLTRDHIIMSIVSVHQPSAMPHQDNKALRVVAKFAGLAVEYEKLPPAVHLSVHPDRVQLGMYAARTW